MKRDIETEADIKLLVDSFYDKVNQDELLSPVFNSFAKVNWQTHLSVMYNFWSTVLLGNMAYRGQPFPRHLRLPIETQHFTRWTALFTQTVDLLFEGEKAEEAKHKATSIAKVFQIRMGLFNAIA